MSASSTRGFKNRPMPRVPLKRRRVNLSPNSDDDAAASPNSVGAIVRKINASLGEIDALRRKSSNLNGKISGQMRDEITNIEKYVETIARGAESLKSKIDALLDENKKLRERKDSVTVENINVGDDVVSTDFHTPKSSQVAGAKMDVDFPAITLKDFEKPSEDFTLVQRKNRPRKAPPIRSYAELLRVDLPPKTLQGRNSSQTLTLSQKQTAEATRAFLEPPQITIRVKGNGIPYEDLVRKVKAGVKPGEYDIVVLSLRKNASLELELRVRGSEDNIAKFKSAISTCISDEGSAQRIQSMAFVHVSDLEAEISAEEIAMDIGKAAKIELQDIKITSLRPAYGNTQKATVKLPHSAALALQKLDRVTVGYVTCRIQIWSFEQRCYRCGESGHLAPSCKGPDKTGMCFRCGSKEHQVRSCQEKREKSTANITN